MARCISKAMLLCCFCICSFGFLYICFLYFGAFISPRRQKQIMRWALYQTWQQNFPSFFCTFFQWCCWAGLIGHSGFNGICIVALCQLFWRDKFEKSNVKIQFLGITAKYEAKADNSSITIHSIFIRNLLLKVNLSSGWPNGGGWRKNICCWWWSYY